MKTTSKAFKDGLFKLISGVLIFSVCFILENMCRLLKFLQKQHLHLQNWILETYQISDESIITDYQQWHVLAEDTKRLALNCWYLNCIWDIDEKEADIMLVRCLRVTRRFGSICPYRYQLERKHSVIETYHHQYIRNVTSINQIKC